MRRLPFNNLVGIRVDRVHRDGVTISCPFGQHLTNIHGTVHGGVSATLADVAGGFSTMAHYGLGSPITTIDLKINYLAPMAGPRVRARGRIVKAGKTLCVIQVEIHGGKAGPGAVATVTYMILPPKN